MFIALSIRNLLRNRGQLAINTIVVMIASCLLVVALGQIGGINRTLTNSVTDTLTGHITIKPSSAPVNFFQFESSRKLPLISPDEIEKTTQALSQLSYVEAVAPRLRFGSLIGDDERSSPAMVFAVDPQLEAKASPDLAEIVAPLSQNGGAVISEKLLKKSRLTLNDYIVVFSETPSSSFNAGQFQLKNTINTPVLIDEYVNNIVFISLEDARHLLYLDGDASEIVIRLKPDFRSKEQLALASREIQGILDANATSLNSYTYSQVESSIENISSIASGMGFIQVGTIMLVMLVTVLILTSISLYERRFEIGALMSIGMTPWRLTLMFMLEVFFKTIIGFLAGFVLGVAILSIINAVGGIQSTSQIDQYIYGGKQMFPIIDLGSSLLGGLLMVLVAMAVTLVSCVRAARQDPVALLNNRK
ncbi:FtsX-like permease family protein [Saccharophagus degradans]|uniref:ABC transporter permease n=1 Tax=Saccharophagus degradans TaxID=86304 RepID=UPI002477EAAD|nr:FtsX-like permease family protein [Saccharophagus degradans]WGO96542.1 FtsX-like permease family protein [Saccharophagus degradans]